jgi:hypothetical protein
MMFPGHRVQACLEPEHGSDALCVSSQLLTCVAGLYASNVPIE